MLCKQNSPINFFIIEIDSGQVCLIRSTSLYVTRKGDVLLQVNLSKVDSRECILLVVADKNYGRCLPFVKIQTRFGSYFQKRRIFPFEKESIFLFGKNHALSEDTKFMHVVSVWCIEKFFFK